MRLCIYGRPTVTTAAGSLFMTSASFTYGLQCRGHKTRETLKHSSLEPLKKNTYKNRFVYFQINELL